MSFYPPPSEKSVGRASAAALAALIALLVSSATLAQVPEPRVVASFGVPDPADPNNVGEPVWETWIAAGDNEVITVHHQEVGSGIRVGYAVYDRQAEEWTDEGIIPEDPNGVRGFGDPSIVWLGEETDEFLACALVRHPTEPKRAIGVARYASGVWDPWEALTVFEGETFNPWYDKPWILAGGEYNGEREIYITFWRRVSSEDPGRHSYLRSTDGGANWTMGDISLGIGGDLVEAARGGYQPTVAGNGPLYIAYRNPGANGKEIRFLKGVDIDDPNDAHFGEVEFSHLIQLCPLGLQFDPPAPLPLVVELNRTLPEIRDRIPGVLNLQTIPFLAADPTDAGQLYLVYHDTETDDPNDTNVNIYLQTLTVQTGGRWCAGDRVRVNDDDTEYESDQFLPSVIVDDSGRIHVIFYDDRRFNVTSDQVDGPNTPNPMFDKFYAYSEDGGVSFEENQELAKDPNGPYPTETGLDYALLDGFNFPGRPGEYNGIAAYGDEIWISFTGTSQEELDGDPDSNPSVIWSCRVPFEPSE